MVQSLAQDLLSPTLDMKLSHRQLFLSLLSCLKSPAELAALWITVLLMLISAATLSIAPLYFADMIKLLSWVPMISYLLAYIVSYITRDLQWASFARVESAIQVRVTEKFLSSQSPSVGELTTCDRKSTRLNSSHSRASRMPSSA